MAATAAALEAKQLEDFKAMLMDRPEVQQLFGMLKQMFGQFGYGGVHEVADNKKTSIGDVALQQTEQTAAQIKEEAAAKVNLPPLPTA